MNYVALSSDQNSVYQFFVPLTCALWRHRVQYEPLVVLVGSEHQWRSLPSSCLVLAALEDMEIPWPTFVETPEGYRSANVAQAARMFAAFNHRLSPDDLVTTSDIDMWPVDGSWFQHHLPVARHVTAYYGNYPSRFPMCYVAADVATWDELHGYRLKLEATTAIWTHMQLHLSPETSWPDAWQHDEEYLTARIHAVCGPERTKLVIRPAGDPFPDRIDRVNWPHEIELGDKKDAHLLRPGWEHWDRLRDLLGKLHPDFVRWADEYVAAYRDLIIKERPQ